VEKTIDVIKLNYDDLNIMEFEVEIYAFTSDGEFDYAIFAIIEDSKGRRFRKIVPEEWIDFFQPKLQERLDELFEIYQEYDYHEEEV
jgi:hypothetical protein